MADMQTNEAVERAKDRLQEVANQKAGITAERKPETPGDKPRTKADMIKPVDKKPKKKGFGQKLKEAFFGENLGDGSITENIFFKIFIPKVKQVLSEMANTAINSALGLDNRTRTFNGGTANTHQANAGYYRDRNMSRGSTIGTARRDAISEITWDGATVNDIYGQMQDLLDQFPEEGLSIADVYSIMDMPTYIRSTDRDWGWRSMRGIELVCVDQARDLWIIDMPAARPL